MVLTLTKANDIELAEPTTDDQQSSQNTKNPIQSFIKNFNLEENSRKLKENILRKHSNFLIF